LSDGAKRGGASFRRNRCADKQLRSRRGSHWARAISPTSLEKLGAACGPIAKGRAEAVDCNLAMVHALQQVSHRFPGQRLPSISAMSPLLPPSQGWRAPCSKGTLCCLPLLIRPAGTVTVLAGSISPHSASVISPVLAAVRIENSRAWARCPKRDYELVHRLNGVHPRAIFPCRLATPVRRRLTSLAPSQASVKVTSRTGPSPISRIFPLDCTAKPQCATSVVFRRARLTAPVDLTESAAVRR
jgi:hypothetical protein